MNAPTDPISVLTTGTAAASPQRRCLADLFGHALRRVDPMAIIPSYLPPRPKGRTVVIGAGKASARMALALERAWDGPLSGVVVTRYGHGEACERIRILEAGHPVPTAASSRAAMAMLEAVRGLGPDDLVISLMSGGGSSLLVQPRRGITLEDKQDLSRQLLRSGANIHEMNTVRKALSAIKGGRLANACGPASLLTLVISDVPGDDPAVVSSGPTVVGAHADAEAALQVLRYYGIAVPPHVEAAMRRPDLEALAATTGERVVKTIATAGDALRAAETRAAELGIEALVLGSRVEGEASEVGRAHAGIALGVADARRSASSGRARPLVVLSGGETTVTVRGNGRGGRNAEFLLGLAIGCAGHGNVHAIACDTDGIDGSQHNAGAFADGHTVARALAADIDPRAAIARNDAYSLFETLGDLVVTGPTRTNVNDFRAVLVE